MKAAELRKSILQMAMQGKLVLQNSKDEPASKLLEKIQKEKAQFIKDGKIKKEKALLPIVEDEKPYDLPDGWIWCRLGEVAIHSLGKMLDASKNKGNLQAYIRNKNVQWFKFDLTDLKEMRIKESEQERYEVRKGDLIICEGGYPGTSAIWNEDYGVYYQKALHRVRFSYDKMNEYFQYFLYFIFLTGDINKYITGAGIQHLTGRALNIIVYPLPPYDEQLRIVAKVDELMEMCDQLEAAEKELDSLEDNFIEYLPKSILQMAVQGKLVPQNLDDNPASKLLDKIRKEKVQLVKEGKLKKEKSLPSISEDEIPYELPNGWEWCRLADVANLYTGNSINENEKKKNYLGISKGYNYIATKDIAGDSTVQYDNGVKIPFDEEKFRIAPTNSILLCIEGGSAGKKITMVDRDVCFVNKLCCFTSYIKNEYLYYYLKSPIFYNQFHHSLTGIIGGVSVSTLKQLIIALPPLAEQQRIVNKVHQLMILSEELRNIKNINIPLTESSNVISFVNIQEEESLLMVAQGVPSQKQSEELRQAIDDLFGDDEDE